MSNAFSKTYPRRFVPAAADMGKWADIEPLFDELNGRPIDTAGQLERWLLDISELASCIHEEGTRRYTAMTCQTDDPAKDKAHLEFVEQITPRFKPRFQQLRLRYVASPARAAVDADRYRVYDRSEMAAVELFRDANVPLQTEEEKISQQYQKICGAMTVQYGGREQTLAQMSKYQLEPDRPVREKTWKLVVERRLADRDSLDEVFDAMIGLRHRMALNADLPSFREYQFKAYERFDYKPADCFAFHDAIEKVVVPAVRQVQRKRKDVMKLDVLRPWDLAVDPRGRGPLKPFATSAELMEKCGRIFARLDAELGDQFAEMVAAGWLDLDSRKGKAPGGYQATFEESRRPFIFMNAVGLHRDVDTLLHEGGHAFHTIACRDEPLISYRHSGMEMAEVASMGMELLTSDLLDEFYASADLARARREKLEGVLSLFPWIAIIDAFQHWLYANPQHTRDARTAQWLELVNRFGGTEDWSGFEATRESLWQRQLHLFEVPFYYIEYGIAQIGALQLWRNCRADPVGALRRYREALALGGSQPLPKLWAAAGLNFDFSAATLTPLIELVQSELAKLAE
jgi:oligoendopeptidase F